MVELYRFKFHSPGLVTRSTLFGIAQSSGVEREYCQITRKRYLAKDVTEMLVVIRGTNSEQTLCAELQHCVSVVLKVTSDDLKLSTMRFKFTRDRTPKATGLNIATLLVPTYAFWEIEYVGRWTTLRNVKQFIFWELHSISISAGKWISLNFIIVYRS